MSGPLLLWADEELLPSERADGSLGCVLEEREDLWSSDEWREEPCLPEPLPW